jgi:hypothetical protein
MLTKAGEIRINHFAHHANFTCAYDWRGETFAHLRAKALAKSWLEEQPECFGATIMLEYALPTMKRIADVMALFADGRQLALEIQLSSITVGRLEQRTADYRALDIPVLWWIGNAADTPAVRRWCAMHCPEYGQLTFEADTPLLHRRPTPSKPFVLLPFWQYHATPFADCPDCGRLVQVRRWHEKEGWKHLSIPESAALGVAHTVEAGTCVLPVNDLGSPR